MLLGVFMFEGKYFKLLHIPTAKLIINPSTGNNSVYWSADSIKYLPYNQIEKVIIERDDSEYLFIITKYDAGGAGRKYITIDKNHLEAIECSHGFEDSIYALSKTMDGLDGFSDEDLARLDKIYLMFVRRMSDSGLFKRGY